MQILLIRMMYQKGKEKNHLSLYSNENCDIIAHTCAPIESRLSSLPCFYKMSCFEIVHTKEASNLFTTIERNGKTYSRVKPKHSICEDLAKLYRKNARVILGGSKRKVGRPRGKIISSISSSSDDSESNITQPRKRNPIRMPPPPSRVTRINHTG